MWDLSVLLVWNWTSGANVVFDGTAVLGFKSEFYEGWKVFSYGLLSWVGSQPVVVFVEVEEIFELVVELVKWVFGL